MCTSSVASPKTSAANMASCQRVAGCAIILTVCIFYGGRAVDNNDNVTFDPPNQNTFQFGQAKPMRFLLYDINPGEGFNLRRDVYMRVANLVKFLNEKEPWTLVLPPWGRLYHWKSEIDQIKVKWATFFDLESLGRHVPVLEFEDYIKVTGKPEIDEIYYLQRYKEGWKKWEEKMDDRECIDNTGFVQDKAGLWRWWFWGYEETYGKQFKCISIQAAATFLKDFLWKSKARSVFLVRAEELIHGDYSEWSELFWTARRSLVFAKHLRDIGDQFRKEHLHSTDDADRTVWEDNWKLMKRNHGDALGGPYVATHIRRQDFLYGHKKDVPSIKGAAKQLGEVLQKNNLTTLFVATDSPKKEYQELKSLLPEFTVERFVPSKEILNKYKDGGVAIIDQWICAHARFFIGTSVSTFTFRIHEEREILGFDPDMTFNRFCGDDQSKDDCEQPSRWTVKYE